MSNRFWAPTKLEKTLLSLNAWLVCVIAVATCVDATKEHGSLRIGGFCLAGALALVAMFTFLLRYSWRIKAKDATHEEWLQGKRDALRLAEACQKVKAELREEWREARSRQGRRCSTRVDVWTENWFPPGLNGTHGEIVLDVDHIRDEQSRSLVGAKLIVWRSLSAAPVLSIDLDSYVLMRGGPLGALASDSARRRVCTIKGSMAELRELHFRIEGEGFFQSPDSTALSIPVLVRSYVD